MLALRFISTRFLAFPRRSLSASIFSRNVGRFDGFYYGRGPDETVLPPLTYKVLHYPEASDTFKPFQTFVLVPLPDGRFLRRRILPSYPAKAEKLAEALAPLLALPDDRNHASEDGNGGFKQDHNSFGTHNWRISHAGDVIHRHLSLGSEDLSKQITERIKSVADEIDHHPHLATKRAKYKGAPDPLWQMTISCTTHSPVGLSMRDVRLATKINELVKDFNVMQLLPVQLDRKIVMHQRSTNIRRNRIRIWKALGIYNPRSLQPKQAENDHKFLEQNSIRYEEKRYLPRQLDADSKVDGG